MVSRTTAAQPGAPADGALWILPAGATGANWSLQPTGALLGLPDGAEPLALLCLGPVGEFYPRPMLVEEGWAEEKPLADMLFENHWGQRP